MKSRFLSIAEEEVSDAALYYETEYFGLGDQFLAAVLHTVKHLEHFPNLGTPIDAVHRGFLVRRFPYQIIYMISADEIVVLAVAHQRRRPGYWKGRL